MASVNAASATLACWPTCPQHSHAPTTEMEKLLASTLPTHRTTHSITSLRNTYAVVHWTGRKMCKCLETQYLLSQLRIGGNHILSELLEYEMGVNSSIDRCHRVLHGTDNNCNNIHRPLLWSSQTVSSSHYKRLPSVGFQSWSRFLPASQPAGDVSHKPGGRLPLLSARPAVTPPTLKRAATNFAAW